MKKFLSAVLVMLLLVSLVGCGGTQDTPPTETPPTQEEETPAVSVSKSTVIGKSDTYYSVSIVGTARNNSDAHVSNIVITITVYDDVDVPMKKLTTTISGLGANEAKEFSHYFKVYKSQGRIPKRSEVTEIKYN